MSRTVRALLSFAVLAVPTMAHAAPTAGVAAVRVATNATRPWVFTDRQGTTHLAWTVTTTGQSQTFYTRAAAGARTFEPARQLAVSATGEDFSGPFIVQDPAPSDRLVITVGRCCTAPSTYALTSSDGGTTWSAGVPIAESSTSHNPGDGRAPLVVDSGTGLTLVSGNPSMRIFSVPATLTPITPSSALVSISPSPIDGQVTLDEAGSPVFGFADFAGKSYVRQGPTAADQIVSETSRGVPALKIAGGPHGVGTLSGVGTNVQERLDFRLLRGGVLGAAIALTGTGDIDQGIPFLAADQSGRFHAAWRAHGTVQYRRSNDGLSWTPATTLVTSPSIYDLVLSAGSDGNGWAVWMDGTSNATVLATPLRTAATVAVVDPSVPDTTGIANPQIIRRGGKIFIVPRNPSLAKLRKTKCINVRVQTTKPARINVAVFSGPKSIRLFGATVVRFTRPGKRTVCVPVPLNAHSFNVRQPFRFAFASKDGAVAKPGEGSAKVTTSDFVNFK